MAEKVLSRAPERGSLVALLLLSLVVIVQSASGPDGYSVVAAYPHDSEAFTQGLVFVDGRIYESTGREGQSSLRMV
jgi:glutaminyl-peptide cyclotransferase